MTPRRKYWFVLFRSLPWIYSIMMFVTSGITFKRNSFDINTCDLTSEKIALIGIPSVFLGLPIIFGVIILMFINCCKKSGFAEWWTDSYVVTNNTNRNAEQTSTNTFIYEPLV